MPEWMIHDLKTLGLSAAITWGFVQAIKPALKLRSIGGEKSQAIIRLVSVILGLVIGAILHPALVEGPIGSSAVIGGGLGAAAGALNAVIVAQLKSRLKSEGQK
jgi:hypothetical protein